MVGAMISSRPDRNELEGKTRSSNLASLRSLQILPVLCFLQQPCAAEAPQEKRAEPRNHVVTANVLDERSQNIIAGSPGIDGDSGNATLPVSAVTFGRALDLEGNPVNLAPSRRGYGLPVAQRAIWNGPASVPSGSPVRASGLSSSFGSRWHPILGVERFHAGIDLAAPTGSVVAATAAGLVRAAGWCGGYGLCVLIDHGGGYSTIYGHLSKLDVVSGQAVGSGQTIGLVGSTGLSTGPHLHYEVRFQERPINPLKYL